jgi:hypothetical protein
MGHVAGVSGNILSRLESIQAGLVTGLFTQAICRSDVIVGRAGGGGDVFCWRIINLTTSVLEIKAAFSSEMNATRPNVSRSKHPNLYQSWH